VITLSSRQTNSSAWPMPNNELGDNRLALDAVCRVSDAVLAEKDQLQRAFAIEPNLARLNAVGLDVMWNQDFPLLSDEPRFKQLMNNGK